MSTLAIGFAAWGAAWIWAAVLTTMFKLIGGGRLDVFFMVFGTLLCVVGLALASWARYS